jgi:hypothetical protein
LPRTASIPRAQRELLSSLRRPTATHMPTHPTHVRPCLSLPPFDGVSRQLAPSPQAQGKERPAQADGWRTAEDKGDPASLGTARGLLPAATTHAAMRLSLLLLGALLALALVSGGVEGRRHHSHPAPAGPAAASGGADAVAPGLHAAASATSEAETRIQEANAQYTHLHAQINAAFKPLEESGLLQSGQSLLRSPLVTGHTPVARSPRDQ